MVQSPEERVKVAYFVPPSKHFAGIERVVHEIATGLMEAHSGQLDVHVLFSTSYDEDLLESPAYTMHTLGVERLRNLAASLRACVAEEKFDVLICPQVEASVIGWLATRGLGVPIFVSHLHGNPRIEEKDGSRRTKVAFAFFRHCISRRISAVLAVSPSLRQYAAAAVTPRAPVYYAKNPVRDLGEPGIRPAGEEDRFRFLSVGRLSRQKGQDILLHALAIARPDLPAVKLTLVGTGPEEAELKKLTRDLGLDDIVDFTGYTSDPAGHFRAADCFVLASRWEGFGVVLVEALHFGLPLLAADCEFGPSDIITDPAIGELVGTDSAETLAEGLKRAVRSESKDLAKEKRRALAASFSRSAATEMHYEILKQIVAAKPRRSARLAAFATA